MLIASNLFGSWLPNPLGSVIAQLPVLASLTLFLAFPLVVMVPALVIASARASWRANAVGAGMRLGLAVSFLTTTVMLASLVIGLALGQPQLLRMGLAWESLRDLARTLATTTATGAALGAVGALAGAAARRFSHAAASREP